MTSKKGIYAFPKKGNAKECSNYHTIALFSHAINVQNSPARLQQYVNHQIPDVKAGFRKGRGTRNQIANICWIIEKAREFQRNMYFSSKHLMKMSRIITRLLYQHKI